MKTRYIILCLLVSFLALSCASNRRQKVQSEPPQLDKEQVWQLTSLQGRPLPAGSTEVLLMFYPDGNALRGRIACNRYFADYKVNPVKMKPEGTRYTIQVTDISGGDVQCPEGGMELQQRYLAVLSRVTSCHLTSYTLTFYQKDKEVLKFELQ